jgi:predicted ATP-grasp superfamily ATP-dependent carboligase
LTTVLLAGAGGSAGANFCQALRLGKRRYRVIGADASAVHLHLATADVRVVVPRAGEQNYVEALQWVIERYGAEVVHPQPDPDVRAIGAARDDLSAATYLPPQTTLELVADKLTFASVLRDKGVPVPESTAIESIDRVRVVVSALLKEHPRVWVRARVGAGARASLPVRSPDQAEAWISWWIDEKGFEAADFMACEFLPGREYAYQSVWQDGELVAGQARERLEYLYGHLTPSGQTSTPAVARTVSDPRIDNLACAAIRALDTTPCGVYCVDVKEDQDGSVKVTEINAGRFFTTSNFFAEAGLNMPDLLVRCALGERPPRLRSSPLPADLYWIRMVDMGYRLVPGDGLDLWPRANS